MLQREGLALDLVHTYQPQPSLEISGRSLDGLGKSIREIAEPALRKLAQRFPKLRATVYLYGSISANFQESAWSEFLVPVEEGDSPQTLRALHAAFTACGVQCKMSDPIQPSEAVYLFHIQEEQVWQPLDAASWFAQEA